MPLYFARTDSKGLPEAIFTGRFIFFSPRKYETNCLAVATKEINVFGLDNFLLEFRPKGDFQKSIFEEALHAWINQQANSYHCLTTLRRRTRWRWILRHDAGSVKNYYEARTLFFTVMNPEQEAIAEHIEDNLSYRLRKDLLREIQDKMKDVDSQTLELICDRAGDTADFFRKNKLLFSKFALNRHHPPCVVVVSPPPNELEENHFVLGKGWFPSDSELGYDGDIKTVLRSKRPFSVIYKRFQSPEFYRRNTFADDLAWTHIKFTTEEEMWSSVRDMLCRKGTTLPKQFLDYKAALINFASEWAGLTNRSEIVSLWRTITIGKYDSPQPSERFKKSVNFFYLHDN